MITMGAEIIAKNTNTLSRIDSSISKNNISTDITYFFNKSSNGSNPFLLGASKLGSTAKLSSKEDYYIGKVVCDSNGNFYEPYVITIKGKDIETLIITFDSFNKQYPKNVIVNGTSYPCDSSVFKVQVDKTNSVTVIINNWNRANYPLRIQGISGFYISLNQHNIISIRNSIYDRNDERTPSYGLFSNVGNLKFIDVDSRVRFYIEARQLDESKLCQMYLANNSNKQEVGLFYTHQWNYNNNTNEVNVTLQDNLIEWQKINVEGIAYNYKNPISRPLKYFYDYLKDIAENNGFEFEPLDSTTYNILNTTTINYVFLESDTLWKEFEKLCVVAQLYIYKNNDNKVVVIHKI